MVKTTLDTNIIVSAFVEEDACVKIVDGFLSKEKSDSDNNFLTPAVLDELTFLFVRFQSLLHNTKTIMERKKWSFIESYTELERTIDGGSGGSLANAFGNLILFVEKSEARGLTIQTIIDMLKQKVARWYRLDIQVSPSFDTVRARGTEVDEIKKDIVSKKINKKGDALILAQLILFNRITMNDIQLYTKNTDDFNSLLDAWKELCPFISVVSP